LWMDLGLGLGLGLGLRLDLDLLGRLAGGLGWRLGSSRH